MERDPEYQNRILDAIEALENAREKLTLLWAASMSSKFDPFKEGQLTMEQRTAIGKRHINATLDDIEERAHRLGYRLTR